MEQDKWIEKIEELNLENILLKKSKEYKLGQDIIKFKEMITKFKWITFFKKISNRSKIQKYNAHGELENSFECDKIQKDSIDTPKIVVYTSIMGNYDTLQAPFLSFDNIDYVVFSDQLQTDKEGWNYKELPEQVKNIPNNITKNRYVKFHPHELFDKEYDYAIYIDGNIKVMSDLTDLVYAINPKSGLALHRHQFRNCIFKEIEVCKLLKKGNYEKLRQQVQKYKQEGFKEEFGLLECNVIVTDLKSTIAKNVLEEWWKEFICSESYRDQISLPYVLWKNGYEIQDIGNLGNNVYENPKIRILEHKN